MCLTSLASYGENVEINLLAEDNLAHSRVIFHETVMFHDPGLSRQGRPGWAVAVRGRRRTLGRTAVGLAGRQRPTIGYGDDY